MLKVELYLSNEECAALNTDLADVEEVMERRIAKELPDEHETANATYCVLGRLLGPVREHLVKLAQPINKESAGGNTP
jgi:hypothetical protein